MSVTRTRAQWERFTQMISDMETSTVNLQVGHRGPTAMLGSSREHADDEVSITSLLPLVTLDSSVEEASEDEISVVPPPRTSSRGRVSPPPARDSTALSPRPPSHHPRCPVTTALTTAPILPLLPRIPLPHTIMPDMASLRMSPARTSQAPAPPATPPQPLTPQHRPAQM